MADIYRRICGPEVRDAAVPSVLWGCWHRCRTVGVGSEGHEDHRRGSDNHHIFHVSVCSVLHVRVISCV